MAHYKRKIITTFVEKNITDNLNVHKEMEHGKKNPKHSWHKENARIKYNN